MVCYTFKLLVKVLFYCVVYSRNKGNICIYDMLSWVLGFVEHQLEYRPEEQITECVMILKHNVDADASDAFSPCRLQA